MTRPKSEHKKTLLLVKVPSLSLGVLEKPPWAKSELKGKSFFDQKTNKGSVKQRDDLLIRREGENFSWTSCGEKRVVSERKSGELNFLFREIKSFEPKQSEHQINSNDAG